VVVEQVRHQHRLKELLAQLQFLTQAQLQVAVVVVVGRAISQAQLAARAAVEQWDQPQIQVAQLVELHKEIRAV
jgi:hypothetical protein